MQSRDRQKWNQRLVVFLDLLLVEGDEILLRTKNEETLLLEVQKELNTVPHLWKQSFSYTLQWVFRNIFLRRKIFRKIGSEMGEIEKARAIISFHLAYCIALHKNVSKLNREEVNEALSAMLEKWFVFDLLDHHRRKFVNFSSEVRLYNIKQLLG
ncbi:MAG: hypothetical protein US70_C0012G0022 [Parcubacteria group bacterium GW2011_GWD2_38_11]|nr:MAG: hypothetical protein US70_C0012G0022 [Parcubacteria group bacterium GW2011_GWD2_38_11]